MRFTIQIGGMSCEHCVKAVETALSGIDGVSDITVSLSSGSASFEAASSDLLSYAQAAVRDEGYDVS